MRKLFFFCLSAAFVLSAGVSRAQTTSTVDTTFIPIGGGYADTYAGVIKAALQHASGDTIHILVLPVTYASTADTITDDERKTNIDDANVRRSEIEDACKAAAPAGKTCSVVLAPIFTHSDATDDAVKTYFTDDLALIYILGGDQDVAMQVVMNTPIEAALEKAWQSGVPIAGTSAGLSVQSKTMIGGYLGDFGPESGVNQGSVDLWDSADKRGLSFGLSNVILEQHFWERGRIARLLNALAQPNVPPIGIGVDTYTALQITDGTQVGNVFGLYDAAILDAQTFGAAAKSTFKNSILSIHDVLFHLLAPGDFSYNLTTRTTSIANLPTSVDRTSDAFALPKGAGALILAGDLSDTMTVNRAALDEFLRLSGGTNATILVVATGYASDDDAQNAIINYGTTLGTQTVGLILKPDSTAEIPPNSPGYGGIVMIAPDQSTIQPELLDVVVNAWRTGKPLLLDNAAAAIAGPYYSAQAPTPAETDAEPDADIEYIQNAFLKDQTKIEKGLNLLPVMVEPRLMADYRWGRLVALAYAHPDTLAVGIPDNAALEITPDGAVVLGANGVFTLDLRQAALKLGTNKAYVFANGLLDVFAPSETIAFG